MTQVAVVPASRPVNIVGQDIVAVVHNTSDREVRIDPHDGKAGAVLGAGESATVHGPCAAIAVGGDASIVVDENAVEPTSPLAEASPQAAVQALVEELTRDKAALQRDRDEFERQKQEVTALEQRAHDATAALEWALEQSAQPDPQERKPNRKSKKAGTSAKSNTRSR